MTAGSLTARELRDVVGELAPRVVGGTVRAVESVKPGVLCFDLVGPRGEAWLVAAVREPFARLHLSPVKPPLQSPEPGARELDTRLRGAVLEDATTLDGDRCAVIRFRTPSAAALVLRFELFSKRPNWILTDASGTVTALLTPVASARRVLRAGGPDAPPLTPPSRNEAEPPPRFPPPDDELSLNRAVARTFDELETRGALDAERLLLTREIEGRIRSRQVRLAGLQSSLEAARDSDALEQRAGLLSAERHRIPRGASEARVVNYFDPGLAEISIPLDPALDLQTQIDKLYTRIRRLRAGVPKTLDEIGRAERELAILTQARDECAACEDLDELASLRARLVRGRHLTARERPAPARTIPSPPAEDFRRFRSLDGFEILVGKGDKQNEALTFHAARGNDLWLHAGSGVAGSHVVVRIPKGKSAPLETLLDAATLALHFSKVRGASRGDVVYTHRKHVSKPRGARAGSVAITGERHLSIDLERPRLDRLLSGLRPELGDSP